jgi:hypothetical protein
MHALEPTNLRKGRWVDLLLVSVPKQIIVGYVAVLSILYIVVATHTPIVVNPLAAHDDGLFMTLGRHLAEGNWLGPFSQFTLMKGPGYPAFLAVAQWLGISVTLAHALFHCFAITAFVAILHRFVKSYLLSGLMFALLLWHPVTLSVQLLRVFREEIYYGQVLLIMAAVTAALFCAFDGRRRVLFAILGGTVLGWFWLTREEGVWLLPGIAIIVAASAWSAYRAGRTRQLLASLSIIICTFAFMQIGFRAGNLWAYGKFVGVDVKEANYVRALGVIDSVRSGGNKPFIPVTKSARERIYAVSPTFASLRDYFDGPRELGWVTITCQFYPESCGEIAAGWFLWALREAASQRGYYASPAKASAFFGKLADEISAACARSELVCAPQLFPEMPQVTWKDLTERVPPRYTDAIDLLLLIQPPLQFNFSGGTEVDLRPALNFLNRPLYSRSPDLPSVVTQYTLSAWYYKSGSDWISAEVKNPDGSPVDTKFVRTPSPDIQAGFKDPAASQQRFMLETTCNDKCILEVETPEGQKAEKELGEFRLGRSEIKVAGGTVHVDSTTIKSDPFASTRIEELCNRLRISIMTHYFWVSIPVLIVGLLSFLIVTAMSWRKALDDVCYVVGVACWLLVLVRTSLLVLIDSTSFPALMGAYMAPAYFSMIGGAVLFSAALLNRVAAPVARKGASTSAEHPERPV